MVTEKTKTTADLILQEVKEMRADLMTRHEANAPMAEEFAKLSDDLGAMAEENVALKAELEHLNSQEHSDEVIAYFLQGDFQDADPVMKAELGRKLGLTEMFEQAEVAEELEEGETPVEEKSELQLIGEFLLGRS